MSKENVRGMQDDTISRQQAIDAIDGYMEKLRIHIATPNDTESYSYARGLLVGVINDIKQLPPIQPKRGKWIYCEDSTADCVDGYRCDQCGFFVPWDYQHKGIDFIQDYNFCPHCGAKMEVTE